MPEAASTSQTPSATGYTVGKPRGVCCVTEQPIKPGQPFVAALRDGEQGVHRLDFTPDAWDQLPEDQQQAMLAHWHTTMPAEDNSKKKLLVDDDVLMELFRRLESAETDEKLAFRFMLGLMLMRKKHLSFESSRTDDAGREVWTMRPRKSEETLEVVDPKLDEAQLDAVGEQVQQILASGVEAETLDGGA